MRLRDFAGATRAHGHDPSGVVGVKLGGSVREPFFSRWLHNNVRSGQKQQPAPNDRGTFPARRQSSYLPTLRAIRKLISHQALVRLKVASQDDDLVDPIVTPMDRSRPSVLKH